LEVEEATARMSKAINKCEAAVTNGIGVDLMRRGLDAEAVDRFERAANTSVEHASASYNLGLCHAFGRGTSKDMNKAFVLFHFDTAHRRYLQAVESWKVAVAHGHAGASYQLGVCHVRGLGGLVADAQLGASMIRVAAEAAVPEVRFFG
jgi:TPR repeat protein